MMNYFKENIQQTDFFKEENDYEKHCDNKNFNHYCISQGAEYLAMSYFSYKGCEIFAAPESNTIDFVAKINDKYIGIQVKSASLRLRDGIYTYETRKRNKHQTKQRTVLGKWNGYSYKDVQIFIFVANDIKKIYLMINDEKAKHIRLSLQDFINFEKNYEYNFDQIIQKVSNDL